MLLRSIRSFGVCINSTLFSSIGLIGNCRFTIELIQCILFSFFLVYLCMRGENPREHPIRQELVMVQLILLTDLCQTIMTCVVLILSYNMSVL